jgi:hypothetical protein
VCQSTTIKYLISAVVRRDRAIGPLQRRLAAPASSADITGHNGQSVSGLPKMLMAGYRRAVSDVCHLGAGCACLDRSFNGVVGWTHQDSKPNNVLLISTTGTTAEGDISRRKMPTHNPNFSHYPRNISLIAIQVFPGTPARLGHGRGRALYERYRIRITAVTGAARLAR